VLIYNNGRLPESWTAEDLFARHTSIPHNPLIPGAFFRSGQIEAWGRRRDNYSIHSKKVDFLCIKSTFCMDEDDKGLDNR
jgi:ATP-dependent DNA helicase RecG